MVKYVGCDPFPASLITIVSIIFGWGLCAWLCTPYAARLVKSDDANALPGTLGVKRTPLPPILLPAVTAGGLVIGIPTPQNTPFLGRFSPVFRRFSAVALRCPASWRRDGENGRKMAKNGRNLGEKRARNSGG